VKETVARRRHRMSKMVKRMKAAASQIHCLRLPYRTARCATHTTLPPHRCAAHYRRASSALRAPRARTHNCTAPPATHHAPRSLRRAVSHLLRALLRCCTLRRDDGVISVKISDVSWRRRQAVKSMLSGVSVINGDKRLDSNQSKCRSSSQRQ